MEEKTDQKIAVIFPGIGYTCDKPLLYYTKRFLQQSGYEIRDIEYPKFASGIKGDKEKMLQAAEQGLAAAEEQLKDISFDKCEDVIFVSKSIGTAIAVSLSLRHGIRLRNIFFTPLEYTFRPNMPSGIAFTGTRDPWVDTETVKDACSRYRIALTIIKDANHSLESEDIYLNMDIVKAVMVKVEDYINNGSKLS